LFSDLIMSCQDGLMPSSPDPFQYDPWTDQNHVQLCSTYG